MVAFSSAREVICNSKDNICASSVPVAVGSHKGLQPVCIAMDTLGSIENALKASVSTASLVVGLLVYRDLNDNL